ncbi:hypothetical protein [Streptomyces sp. NPDC018833]|uniref:hypothetical protein n=1 Tax=Streptomyces sp. NPDC018833 TaxID=3365053 RepID=UPI00378D75BC
MISAVGRHRAPRPQTTTRQLVSRASAVAAAVGPPVIGAGTANALDGDGDTCTVASGDSLSAIAEEQGAEGGWQQLYADNKSVIGDDPDLLSIALKLTMDRPTDTDTGTTTAIGASYGSNTEETAPTAVPRSTGAP